MIKRVFSIINLLLVTLGVFFAVQLFYQLVSAKFLDVPVETLIQRTAPRAAAGDTTTGLVRKNPSFGAYAAIYNRDLFKTTPEKIPEKREQIELENLQQTQLNLKLWGTVTGKDEESPSYAVIEDQKNRRQGLYREGDAISDATIKMILRKKVVLNVNGKDEILIMEEEKDGRGLPSPRDRFAEPEPEAASYEPADETVSIDREEINDALRNINQLMSQVKVRPHFQNGQPSGLILSHIRPNSIFQDMGLQNGDIVKGVNGNEIESVDDALKFYENLKSSSTVELQIERGGESLSISYQIQ